MRFDHAEAVPDGPSLRAWVDFAGRYQVYLAAGLNEIDGAQLFNTAVLLGRTVLSASTARPIYGTWRSCGSPRETRDFQVFETPIGRIGMLICWDIWFPEVPRISASRVPISFAA